MSERDYLAKGEALRRLSEPEGDHELHTALAGMRESHPHLWEVIHRVHLSRDADPAKLEEWRRAPEGSQEDIWASHYDEAMGGPGSSAPVASGGRIDAPRHATLG